MKENKLKVNYSKRERDLMIHHPLGIGTKADAHFLSGFFNQEFSDELTRRGYDITTLKFEVKPLLPNIKKFPTLSEHANPKLHNQNKPIQNRG